jgi:hypothetical protein
MPKPSNYGKSIPSAAAKSTAPRNSPQPRPEPAKRQVTHEQIAKRAYEIFVSGKGGNAIDNWLRAERELRGL